MRREDDARRAAAMAVVARIVLVHAEVEEEEMVHEEVAQAKEAALDKDDDRIKSRAKDVKSEMLGQELRSEAEPVRAMGRGRGRKKEDVLDPKGDDSNDDNNSCKIGGEEEVSHHGHGVGGDKGSEVILGKQGGDVYMQGVEECDGNADDPDYNTVGPEFKADARTISEQFNEVSQQLLEQLQALELMAKRRCAA
eukprot:TRINITY_DN42048_c0_g1_i1.p2 TRINITY_DN42048_c0_g1~~TRINITY_DN42048_c0_g1_i1.p2  ORF type:complete len:195 (+),score=64.78 TRINITY_DN42048_c0_g1_i1:325-909(+)